MANINKMTTLFFIIGIFLIGCSNLSNAEPTSGHPLFSAEKDKYALLVVDKKKLIIIVNC